MKTTIYIIGAVAILGGIYFLFSGTGKSSVSQITDPKDLVGKQIVEINVKAGYSPKISLAKANMGTVIRFKTDNTFDCSSSVRISKLGFNTNLPSSGSTDFDIGTQSAGTIQGTCGMGMYPFSLKFE